MACESLCWIELTLLYMCFMFMPPLPLLCTESRIKTSAEREFYARNLIRKELVEKAMNNDVMGVKVLLEEVAAECSTNSNADGRCVFMSFVSFDL